MKLIEVELITHKRDSTPEYEIIVLCNQVRLVLQLWNKAFAMMNKRGPSNEECDETQKQIDLAIQQMLLMGLPIMPKDHSLWAHLVQQMRTITGGIAMLLEYWVEHYHQVAHRYDCYWRAQPTHQKQAKVRAKMENAFRNVNTKKELRKVQSKYVRVRKHAKNLATVRKEAKIM